MSCRCEYSEDSDEESDDDECEDECYQPCYRECDYGCNNRNPWWCPSIPPTPNPAPNPAPGPSPSPSISEPVWPPLPDTGVINGILLAKGTIDPNYVIVKTSDNRTKMNFLSAEDNGWIGTNYKIAPGQSITVNVQFSTPTWDGKTLKTKEPKIMYSSPPAGHYNVNINGIVVNTGNVPVKYQDVNIYSIELKNISTTYEYIGINYKISEIYPPNLATAINF